MIGLTKDRAIELHRDMWGWIANEIEQNKKVLEVPYLKCRYCNQTEFGRVYNHCFLCDYTEGDCRLCPLQWDSIADEFMCERYENSYICEGICYDDNNGLWLKCCDAETWEEQAALARQIANLPERESI